jgi:hypothetical protein
VDDVVTDKVSVAGSWTRIVQHVGRYVAVEVEVLPALGAENDDGVASRSSEVPESSAAVSVDIGGLLREEFGFDEENGPDVSSGFADVSLFVLLDVSVSIGVAVAP